MARRQIHLERVLGLLVRDVDGRKAGHLEEAHAELRSGECFLTEYLLVPLRNADTSKRRSSSIAAPTAGAMSLFSLAVNYRHDDRSVGR